MTESKITIRLAALGQGVVGKALAGTSGKVKSLRDSLGSLKKASAQISEYRKLGKQWKETGSKLAETQKKIKSLSQEMRKSKSPTKEMVREFERAKKEGKRLKDTLRRQEIGWHGLRKELRGAGVDIKKLNTEEKRLAAQIDRTDKHIKRQAVGGAVRQGIGSGLKNLVTAGGIGLGLRSMVNASGDINLAKGEVASLGVSKKGLALLDKMAVDISNRFYNMRAPEIIRAAYDLKSGVSQLGDQALATVTGIAAVTAKGTKADSGTITALFAQGYGIFQKQFYEEQARTNKNWAKLSSDQKDIEFFKYFSGSLSQTVQNFRTTGSKMSDFFSTLGAAATSAGVSMKEQMAIGGMLQKTTKGGGEAGTLYRAFLRSAGKAGKTLGMDFTDEAGMLLSTDDIMAQLHDAFGKTIDDAEKQQLQTAFGSEEAAAFVQLLFENADEIAAERVKIDAAGKRGPAVAEGMATAFDRGMTADLGIINQRLTNLSGVLGDKLAPVVHLAVLAVSPLLVSLQSLVEHGGMAATVVTSLATAAGAVAAAKIGWGVLKRLTGIGGVSLPFGKKGKGDTGGILGAVIGKGTPVFVTNWPGGGFSAFGSGGTIKDGKTILSGMKRGGGKMWKRVAESRIGRLAGSWGGKVLARRPILKTIGKTVLEKGGAVSALGKGLLTKIPLLGGKLTGMLGKGILKKIPLVGALIGSGFAINRALQGDWKGSAMEMASGLASTLPGLGTAASVAMDGLLMYRDINREKQGSATGGDLEKNTGTPAPDIAIHQTLNVDAGVDAKHFERLLNKGNRELVQLIRDVIRDADHGERRTSFGGAQIV